MPSKSSNKQCVAGVLVGGRSRRMGINKARLTLPNGSMFMEHVCSVATTVADDVVLLGACDILPTGTTRALPDLIADGGPMIGLYALLAYAKQRWAMLLSCDIPLLQSSTLTRLLAVPREGDIVAFSRTGPNNSTHWPSGTQSNCDFGRQLHTCCALYHPNLLPRVREMIKAGERSLHTLMRQAIVTTITPTADESLSLTNVNTPDDMTRLGLAGKQAVAR